jgi:hypothetical protein
MLLLSFGSIYSESSLSLSFATTSKRFPNVDIFLSEAFILLFNFLFSNYTAIFSKSKSFISVS